MTISPDVLNDFIDGKLSSEEASAIAAKLASDPELAAYVEDQKAVRAALTAPAVLRLRRLNERIAGASAAWIPAAAVAAGIVLGVLLAASFGIGTDLRGASGSLVAQGELAQALSTRLSSEEAQGNAQVGASFWSKNGAFCRSFATRGSTKAP
jgi:anti-sigma factor RsiW